MGEMGGRSRGGGIVLEEGGLSARGKGGGIMFVLNRKEKERGRKKEICFNSVLTFGYLK